MNLSAIHKIIITASNGTSVVCDIGGYEFVSYSQGAIRSATFLLCCL